MQGKSIAFLLLFAVHNFFLVVVQAMVEGHSVHRVATLHRQRLLGKIFHARSPNGRFTEGAKAIDQKVFYRIEAVGKNLFAFFKHPHQSERESVVVHVHFGMAGAWAVYQHDEVVPEPSPTNRLRLELPEESLTADLSAMTVNYGGIEDLYEGKRAKLGQDPLRTDADPNLLWNRVQKSKKSIGALIMDQSFFTGPGNIYRAEILFKAGVHPDLPGMTLERQEFDLIWKHTVSLLQRGYQTGSILTVDPEEAKQLGKPTLRRYIYNTSRCPRCNTGIQVWTIASRTCYACPTCQPRQRGVKVEDGKASVKTVDCVPFNSHCARESVTARLQESGPDRLTVKELKEQLRSMGVTSIPKGTKKAALVELFVKEQQQGVKSEIKVKMEASTSDDTKSVYSIKEESVAILSSEAAAAEKAAANESLAVEHIAELGPGQARRARANAAVKKAHSTMTSVASTPKKAQTRKRGRAPATAAKAVTPSPKKSRRSSPRTRTNY